MNEQLRVTPIDPIRESAVLDGYVQFSLATGDQVRDEFGFGEQRTRTDGQFTVTFQMTPSQYAQWVSVISTPQLAIESRAGQQRRLWREFMRENWPPIELRRWLPEDPDPTRWEIHVGD